MDTPSNQDAIKQGNRRFSPPWWDDHRHVNYSLRRAIEKRVKGSLPLSAGQRIVDLGCGDRPYERLFTSVGCEYVGCDLADTADVVLEPGKKSSLGDGIADGVVSFQVLEHVWELDWYLGEALRVVKPTGWLLLSTHGTWPYHPHPGDYRRWTRDGLMRDITEQGFIVESVDSVVGPLAWTTQIRLLGYRHGLLKIPILGRMAVSLLACVMNLRMWLEDAITPATIRNSNACIYLLLCRRA